MEPNLIERRENLDFKKKAVHFCSVHGINRLSKILRRGEQEYLR